MPQSTVTAFVASAVIAKPVCLTCVRATMVIAVVMTVAVRPELVKLSQSHATIPVVNLVAVKMAL